MSGDETLERARAVLEAWCRVTGHDVDELLGRRRTAELDAARGDAMLAVYEQCDIGTVALGRLFDGRDHTTVVTVLARARERRTEATIPPELRAEKRCPRCGETKSLHEFNRNRSKPDGRQEYCRGCQSELNREREGRVGPRRRRNAVRTANLTMRVPEPLMGALRATAAAFGQRQTAIVERAIDRELRRMWATCRRCDRRPRVTDSELCSECIADQIRQGRATDAA